MIKLVVYIKWVMRAVANDKISVFYYKPINHKIKIKKSEVLT